MGYGYAETFDPRRNYWLDMIANENYYSPSATGAATTFQVSNTYALVRRLQEREDLKKII